MSKFKITITRTDEYDVDIDESIWTPKEIENWEKTFFPTSGPEKLAEHLSFAVMREGSGNGFIEGFGYVKILRKNGEVKSQFDAQFKKIEDDKYTKGLSIKIISEDQDYEFETKELTVS